MEFNRNGRRRTSDINMFVDREDDKDDRDGEESTKPKEKFDPKKIIDKYRAKHSNKCHDQERKSKTPDEKPSKP